MSNNKTKARLIIFSAPSGTGKSSLIKEVIDLSSNNIELSISATTREPRDKEIHGKDYFFISDEEFNNLKDNDAFIEDATVHGYQYGTLKSFVDEKILEGIDIILDIDVQGFNQIENSNIDNLSIFVIPPSLNELRNRLLLRGSDTSDAIEERLANAEKELEFAESFDYLVLNDKFDETIKELSSIIFDENHEYNRDYNLNILRNLLDKKVN
ncbi:MAG: guanylate kinase [Gammaproteobacteria bacterium]|nr:guanylate kinase [Gammaproteobacteria bacterium]|tara:strand:- start:4910 stop:5545 length:636 start_codon:yes stop_codon:yes gene_type:complete